MALSDSPSKVSDSAKTKKSRKFSFSLPKDVCPKTFALFVVYGVGAWVTINGIFSELPLIVNDLPESWAIASYITLIIQIANIGPVLYLLFQQRIGLYHGNVIVLLLGALAMCFLGFFWNQTSSISGSRHSEALFILVFFAALADCTTSVIFWPFVALFHHDYVAAITAGEGLSGLLASVATWIQNAPSSGLLFSPMVYFFILAFFLICSLLAFLFLERIPASANQRRKDNLPLNSLDPGLPAAPTNINEKETGAADGVNDVLQDSDSTALLPSASRTGASALVRLRWSTVLPYGATVAWISFCQNGMKPSIMSYATLPYGTAAYHWSTNLALTLDPLCAALCLLVSVSPVVLWLLTLCWTAIMAFLLALALLSPSPPAACGPFLVVFLSALASGLMAFTKCSCVQFIQRLHTAHSKHTTPLAQILGQRNYSLARLVTEGALPTLLGLCVQIGSLVGALLFFVLVNHTSLFGQ